MAKRLDVEKRKKEIEAWISEELSLAEISRRLNCKFETLKSYLKKWKIDYKGQQGQKGRNKGKFYKTAVEYLNSNSLIKSHFLKQKLLRDGLKKHQCELCGMREWLGNPIPLELHHIDGNHYNNSLENLKLLCPNCHAIQENNSGKNTISHRKKEKEKKFLKPKGYDPKIWEERKNIIINSNVDFKKYGWQKQVELKTNLTRRQISDTISYYRQLFDSISFSRKNKCPNTREGTEATLRT